jgi:hypothetical protein
VGRPSIALKVYRKSTEKRFTSKAAKRSEALSTA